MKKIVYRLLCGLLLLLPFLPLFVNASPETASAFESTVVVTQNGEQYSFTADGNTYGSFPSLQDAVDAATEANEGPTVFSFSNVASSSPLVVSSNLSFGGSLSFTLSEDTYAVTVLRGSRLNLSGVTIASDKGGLRIRSGAFLTMNSGTIRVHDTSFGCSALRVEGEATVYGGTILFENTPGCDGISVADNASLTIEATYPVNVTAPTALRLQGGTTIVNGGTFVANGERLDGQNTGYALSVENAASVTVSGGVFSDPIYLMGQNASVCLSDGTFDSFRFGFFSSGFSGSVRIGNSVFTPPAYAYVDLDLTGFDENEASFTSERGFAGYRASSACTNEVSYAPGEVFPLGDPVTFTESDEYVLRLYGDALYSENTYSYNTAFDCDDLPFSKTGYAPVSYHVGSPSGPTVDSFCLTSDTDIYVESSLLPCVVQAENEISFVYDGTPVDITPAVTHPLIDDPGATVTFLWEKLLPSGYQVISTEKTLTVAVVNDSGSYRFTATITHEDNERSVSVDCAVTIRKAQYENVAHDPLNGKYNPNKTLSAYALEDFFRWENGSTVPTVPVTAYPAIFNADPANYEDLPLSVTLVLTKADAVNPDNTLYADVRGTYDPTHTLESAYPLEGTRWEDPDLVPDAGEIECVAYYAPDRDNYEEKRVFVTLHVEKGTYENKDLSFSVRYSPDVSTLNDVKRYVQNTYSGYTVTSGETTVIGENRYACVYNADPTNFYDYVFTLVVTVTKGVIPSEEIPPHDPVRLYYGLPLSAANLVSGFSFVEDDRIPEENGSYEAYYNPDPTYYENALTDIEVELVKLVYTPEEIPSCNPEEIVYDPTRTLRDVPLPEGFFWKDDTLTPTCNTPTYEAYYQGDAWHERADVLVSLSVRKAPVPIPVLASRTFVYDGEPHSLFAENVSPPVTVLSYEGNGRTDAGTYDVTVRFMQEDTDNYESVPTEITGNLTIEKAPSVILAPDRVDVLVGEEIVIEARADNDEQTVILPEFSSAQAGVYPKPLRTNASVNYEAGEKIVIVSVNERQTFVGNIVYPETYDGTYFYGMLSAETGVATDLTPAFVAVEKDGQKGVLLSLGSTSVSRDTVYTVHLLMTEELMKASSLRLIRNGEEVPYTVESNVYLVFDAKNGDELFFVCENKTKPFVWYWIPPVAAVLIAAGVLLILWKKGIVRFPKKKGTDGNA